MGIFFQYLMLYYFMIEKEIKSTGKMAIKALIIKELNRENNITRLSCYYM